MATRRAAYEVERIDGTQPLRAYETPRSRTLAADVTRWLCVIAVGAGVIVIVTACTVLVLALAHAGRWVA